MKESAVDDAIRREVKRLRAAGVPVYAVKTVGSGRQRSGLPDWHVTVRGRSLWVECKVPGKDATPHQAAELARWAAAGAATAVVHTLAEFRAALEAASPGIFPEAGLLRSP